jgi:hypothetical protein
MGVALAAPSAWAISAGCAAVSTQLTGTNQMQTSSAATYNAGDTITIVNSSTFYSGTTLFNDNTQLATVGSGQTTLTYSIPTAGTYTLKVYTAVSNGTASISISATCAAGAEAAATTTGSTISTNAKQSTQYVAPKVMATATTAIGTLIGTNVKGAFSRVGGGVNGRATGTALAGDAPAEVILADASGGLPRTNADSLGGLKQGLLDGKLGGFAEMSYSHLRSREAGGEYVGDVKNGVAGIDYKIQPNLLIGLAAGYEFSAFKTIYNAGWLDGQGLTLAPYLGYAFENFVLDLTVGHSWLAYDTLRGTGGATYGSYNAERNFVTSNLTATYGWQGLRLAPSIGLLYARETAEAYIDSRGAQQGEVTSQMGRASIGGEIGKPLDLSGVCVCSFEPFVKVKLNYDFKHNGRVTLANGQLSAVNDVTGQIGGGFRLSYGRYLALVIDSSYDTLGASDLEGWNIRGRVDFTLPF